MLKGRDFHNKGLATSETAIGNGPFAQHFPQLVCKVTLMMMLEIITSAYMHSLCGAS